MAGVVGSDDTVGGSSPVAGSLNPVDTLAFSTGEVVTEVNMYVGVLTVGEGVFEVGLYEKATFGVGANDGATLAWSKNITIPDAFGPGFLTVPITNEAITATNGNLLAAAVSNKISGAEAQGQLGAISGGGTRSQYTGTELPSVWAQTSSSNRQYAVTVTTVAGGASAPVFSQQPTPDTVTEPAAAGFGTVAASDTTSWQWEAESVNGNNTWVNADTVIPNTTGTTTDTMAIDPTADANDRGIRVIATGAGGSTTSNEVQLTVNAVADTPPTLNPVDDITVNEISLPQNYDMSTYLADAGTGTGLTYSLTSAPAGITIVGGTGIMTIAAGTAVAAHAMSLVATNSAGNDSEAFTATVEAEAAASVISQVTGTETPTSIEIPSTPGPRNVVTEPTLGVPQAGLPYTAGVTLAAGSTLPQLEQVVTNADLEEVSRNITLTRPADTIAINTMIAVAVTTSGSVFDSNMIVVEDDMQASIPLQITVTGGFADMTLTADGVYGYSYSGGAVDQAFDIDVTYYSPATKQMSFATITTIPA